MGAITFEHYQPGEDMQEAFNAAREYDNDTHGNAYDTGTIGQKDRVALVHRQPVPLTKAYTMAGELRERNVAGTGDKYGPAGAIAVAGGERIVRVTITERPDGHLTTEGAAHYSLTEQGLLRAGESVTYGVQGMYQRNTRGRVTTGELEVPVSGGTGGEQTGWLFFGWAAE